MRTGNARGIAPGKPKQIGRPTLSRVLLIQNEQAVEAGLRKQAGYLARRERMCNTDLDKGVTPGAREPPGLFFS
jgi:hypothetical protein